MKGCQRFKEEIQSIMLNGLSFNFCPELINEGAFHPSHAFL